jgi:hypothetical protein
MRERALPWLLLPLAAALGCGAPTGAERTVLFTLTRNCVPPGPVTAVRIRPLGDFPAVDATVLRQDGTVDDFPPLTRALSVTAEAEGWTGRGLRTLDPTSEGGPLSLLLMPNEERCTPGDPDLALPTGGVPLALPDGRLLLIGGEAGVGPVDEVRAFRPGEPLVEREALRLADRRAWHSATLADERTLVVAGGTPFPEALDAAHADYEVHDLVDGTIVEGTLGVARRHHAAVALGDGSVLLVGGRSGPTGAPLSSVERIGGAGERRIGPPAVARVDPVLVRRTDGAIRLLEGLDAGGAPVGLVEALEGDRFRTVATLEPRRGAAVARLAGARILRVGGRDEADRPVGDVDLLLPNDTVVGLPGLLPPLDPVDAVGTLDGGALVVGVQEGEERAFLVDPGQGTVRALPATGRTGSRLVALTDGLVAELRDVASALRRPVDRAAFADLDAPLVPGPREALFEDARGRWEIEDGALVAAVRGARVERSPERFEAAELALRVTGRWRLRLLRDFAEDLVLEITPAEVRGPGACAAPRDGPLIAIRWDPEGLQIEGVRCRLEAPLGRRGVALEAEEAGGRIAVFSMRRR